MTIEQEVDPESYSAIPQNLTAALNQLAEGVIIADAAGKLVYVNTAAEMLHGVRKLEVEPENYADAYQLFTMAGDPHPVEDLPLARAVLKAEIVRNEHWRIRRPDGSEIIAIGSAQPVMDNSGNQIGSVLTLKDDTENLTRQAALEQALSLKEDLLREVNHRVTNNLQLINSLINLHSVQLADEFAKDMMKALTGRMQLIADLHRQLYERGNHQSVEAVDYIAHIARTTHAAISPREDIDLTVTTNGTAIFPCDQALTIALAVNELLSNSFKHAFATTPSPEISISISAVNGTLKIEYQDNGSGIRKSDSTPEGIGRALIQNFSARLNADISETDRAPGSGLIISVPLPERS